MKRCTTFGAAAALGLTAVLLTSCSSSSTSSRTATSSDGATSAGAKDFTKASGPVRGFDGTTVRIAGLGIKSQLPGADTGVAARVKRFNDHNELPGVKLEYVEYADDKADPAVTLNEARRLVAEQKVFAIVGDTSRNNPLAYFQQQKVPYFGAGYDGTYCSLSPTTDVWGFGYAGCLVNPDRKRAPDLNGQFYTYVSDKLGKKKPTVAVLSGDNPSGIAAAKTQGDTARGAGFDVVSVKANVPNPPVADYTPFVEDLLSADSGRQPDVIECALTIDCVPIYTQLMQRGFKGFFLHPLAADQLAKAMNGSVSQVFWATPTATPNPALDAVVGDLKAIKPDASLETGTAGGYFSTDIFIEALKTVARSGKEYITPENVRRAASRQTWEIKGVGGPTEYPASTVYPTPFCASLVVSDGVKFATAIPYGCSKRTFAAS